MEAQHGLGKGTMMTDFDVRRVCEHELEMLREELQADPNNIEIQERIIEVTDLLNTMED
jgi:hypothetical protein